MKVIKLKKYTILKICMGIIFIAVIGIVSTSFGMQYYYKLDFATGLVTASTLNVRSGPGTNYKVVATVNKNEYVRVFAGIGNWYVIQTDSDHIGAVSSQYIKPIYPENTSSKRKYKF